MDDTMKELGDQSIVPAKRELGLPNPSAGLLADNPAAVLASGYNANENFLTAVQDAAMIQEPINRARAYMTVTECLMLANHSSDAEFRLAQTNLREQKQRVDADTTKRGFPHLDETRDVTNAMFEMASLASRRPDQTFTEVVEELHSNILGYRFEDTDVVKSKTTEDVPRLWTHSLVAQEEDLGKLAELLIQNPDRATHTPESILEEMKSIKQDLFARKVANNDKARVLSTLTTVQVFTGNLTAAEETIEELKQFRADKEYDVATQDKIKGVALTAAAQARTAQVLSESTLTPEQTEAVLKSGNEAAITALGYNGFDLDSIWNRGDIGDEVKDHILAGVEKRLEAEEQKLNDRRKLIASRRKDLAPQE